MAAGTPITGDNLGKQIIKDLPHKHGGIPGPDGHNLSRMYGAALTGFMGGEQSANKATSAPVYES
jgi:hypothetical protein